MEPRKTLRICMGTGCHQLGVQEVITRLNALLEAEGLEDEVEMKGMFCARSCDQAIYMSLDGEVFGHIRPYNIESVYREKIRPRLGLGSAADRSGCVEIAEASAHSAGGTVVG